MFVEARLPTTEMVFVALRSADQPVVSLSADVNQILDFQLLDELPFTFEFYEVQMLRRRVSGVVVTVLASRSCSYYISNVNGVLGVLAPMSMTCWCIHPSDIGR